MFDYGNANDNQKQAISTTEGPLLIIAGPGTGKTYTLVKRVVYLITECNVMPEEIMIATFTEKAAKELVTRISNELLSIGISININEMYIGTFHSICLRILKEHLEYTRIKKNYRMLDNFDQQYMVFQKINEFRKVEHFDSLFSNTTGAWRQAETVVKYINNLSEELVDVSLMQQDKDEQVVAIANIMDTYSYIMEQENLIDFSSIQTETYKLLCSHPEILKEIQETDRVPFVRNTINCFMVSVILGIAPFPCFVVKICNSAKYPASKKVVLYETHKTFYGSFGKRMSGSAQLCFKADCIHKDFVIMVPDWMPFRITMKHNTLHVVCKYMFRNSHTFESMDHTNKEIFRFCVRKEFYISFAAMMADHCKASHFIRSFITRIHVYESPVHLIAFASLTGVTASAVSLRRNCLSFWRDEIPMIFDISFYGSQAAHIPLFLDSFKNNF